MFEKIICDDERDIYLDYIEQYLEFIILDFQSMQSSVYMNHLWYSLASDTSFLNISFAPF